MDTPATALRRLLSSLRQESTGGRHFISPYDLRECVKRSHIAAIVNNFYHPEFRRDGVVTRIVKDALKLFCILVWLGSEDQVVHFLDHDELDARLPMEEEQVLRISSVIDSRFWKEIQWEFLPHEFSNFHRRIRDRVILPFIKDDKRSEGASGEVYQTTIAGSHHEFHPDQVG